MKENFNLEIKKERLKNLTKEQFEVTQLSGTELPFRNEYFDHKEEGLYLDIVSNEVLFSSIDKFDSGCGWPSFYKPIANQSLQFVEDNQFGMRRIEVRSVIADSHLGHVFNEPNQVTNLRYCINSASLKFISKNELAENGLSEYLQLFNIEKKHE